MVLGALMEDLVQVVHRNAVGVVGDEHLVDHFDELLVDSADWRLAGRDTFERL